MTGRKEKQRSRERGCCVPGLQFRIEWPCLQIKMWWLGGNMPCGCRGEDCTKQTVHSVQRLQKGVCSYSLLIWGSSGLESKGGTWSEKQQRADRVEPHRSMPCIWLLLSRETGSHESDSEQRRNWSRSAMPCLLAWQQQRKGQSGDCCDNVQERRWWPEVA